MKYVISSFVKSLEKTLLENNADIAVHSMKDMEWKQADGLKIGAVLERISRKDQEHIQITSRTNQNYIQIISNVYQ